MRTPGKRRRAVLVPPEFLISSLTKSFNFIQDVSEATLLRILARFNLPVDFQRADEMSGYGQPATLRVQVFVCGAILRRAGHRVVIHLSAA